MFIDDDTLLKILPGTIINFEGQHSIVSKGRVSIVGTKEKPIIFNSNNKKWGSLAIIGDKSSRSVIENVVFNNGSFDTYDNINLTGMISIYNSNNVKLSNLIIKNNYYGDDTIRAIN